MIEIHAGHDIFENNIVGNSTIICYGHSDDLFCIVTKNELKTKEVKSNNKAFFKLSSLDGRDQLLVFGEYINGTWALGVCQVCEDADIPRFWDISIVNNDDCNYSPKLVIICHTQLK